MKGLSWLLVIAACALVAGGLWYFKYAEKDLENAQSGELGHASAA